MSDYQMASKQSNHLCFFRSLTSCEAVDYFETITEFLLFADVGGMQTFLSALGQAERATRNIHLAVTGFGSISSAAVIIPAAKTPTRPALRMIERPIVRDGVEAMELVFYGNKAGYRRLRDCIKRLVENHTGDPDEHAHFEHSWSAFIVAPSVALNVRAPVRRWTKSNLQHWHSMLSKRNPQYIPTGVSPRAIADGKYRELSPRKGPTVLRNPRQVDWQ
jgi:hypothetical protein